MSVRQAEEVADLLFDGDRKWNRMWNKGPAALRGEPATVELPEGLKITLLSPYEEDLSALHEYWESEIKKKNRPTRTRTSRKKSVDDSDEDVEETVAPQHKRIFVSYSHQDRANFERVAAGLQRELVKVGGTDFELSSDDGDNEQSSTSIHSTIAQSSAADQPTIEQTRDSIESTIEQSSAAIVLLSASYLASDYMSDVELPALLAAARKGRLHLSWLLLKPCDWKATPLARYQPAHDPKRPLATLKGNRLRAALAEIAQNVVSGLKSGHSFDEAGSTNIEQLASQPFRPDSSRVNASSLAMLMEFNQSSLLIGGDASAQVLERSISKVLAQRGIKRLPVGAFLVPHNGSERNLNRELLQLIACDRYLFSTDGTRFRHPHRVTVARILTYGRSSSDAVPTLVFNYRSDASEVWADPELQERHRYRAVYPEGAGGIEIRL